MGQPIVNDFNKDIIYSMDDQFFNDFYNSIFPNIKEIRFEESMEMQMLGIDKTLLFESGYKITIDEKKRRVDYGDILLELVSNEKTGRLGWLYTSQCDYIAYAIIPAKVIYFIPTTLLKLAWYKNQSEWENKYDKKKAYNKGGNRADYVTINIPIPTTVLLNALNQQIINKYD